MGIKLKITTTREGVQEGEAKVFQIGDDNMNKPPTSPEDREPEELAPRFFGGVVVPLVMSVCALWMGIVKKDIMIPVGRYTSKHEYFEGAAAVWAGIGIIAWMFTLHAFFYASRKSHTPGIWIFSAIVALIGGIVCAFVASALQ